MNKKKFLRGDVNNDGMVFWRYSKLYRNGEYWVTKDQFARKKESANSASMKSYKNKRLNRLKNMKNYSALNSGKIRFRSLERTYGISESEYISMLNSQGGLCAICKKPETTKRRGKFCPLSIDHCHKTGAVRKLLCLRCNIGIGLFRDDAEIIASALSYISCFRDISDKRNLK